MLPYPFLLPLLKTMCDLFSARIYACPTASSIILVRFPFHRIFVYISPYIFIILLISNNMLIIPFLPYHAIRINRMNLSAYRRFIIPDDSSECRARIYACRRICFDDQNHMQMIRHDSILINPNIWKNICDLLQTYFGNPSIGCQVLTHAEKLLFLKCTDRYIIIVVLCIVIILQSNSFSLWQFIHDFLFFSARIYMRTSHSFSR